MFKKYVTHKGNRYGKDNYIHTTHFGDVPLWIWAFPRCVLIILVGWLLSLPGNLTDVLILNVLTKIINLLLFIFFFYFIVRAKSVSCLYCAKDEEEANNRVKYYSGSKEYKEIYPKKRLEIEFEDGWYMIFLKKNKNIER